MRAIVLVMDSVGIGGAPDAPAYGDEGANTLGHIAEACALGDADSAIRQGPLHIPHLDELGIGEACELATGRVPQGLSCRGGTLPSHFGCAREISAGKDTPSGHWEIAGFPVPFAWGYFPITTPAFPPELVKRLCDEAELSGILGDCHASGTDIIDRLGPEHLRSGKPICYTSADSVFQIAAHEVEFGRDRLYRVCQIARRLVDPLNIGRVIARPFQGNARNGFKRTSGRKDFSVPPPGTTMLDLAQADGRDIVTIGKIDDIFAHRAVGRNLRGDGNEALFDCTLQGVDELAEGGLLFANFVDFDTVYGHRRDVAGYAAALEAFDVRLSELLDRLRRDDLLVITADHGCDPTWPGTDHTREQIPILMSGKLSGRPVGRRESFSDIGASIAHHLALPPLLRGTPI